MQTATASRCRSSRARLSRRSSPVGYSMPDFDTADSASHAPSNPHRGPDRCATDTMIHVVPSDRYLFGYKVATYFLAWCDRVDHPTAQIRTADHFGITDEECAAI